MFHSFCGLLLTRGRKPRWSLCALKRDRPTNQPRWPGQHSLFKHKRDYPLFGTTIWIQKGCPLFKSWFQGLLLCSLINGTKCVWYGTYLDCSSKTHTRNFTQKRSSGTATSTSGIPGLQVPFWWSQVSSSKHSLKGGPRINLLWLLLWTCYFSMALSHD